MTSDNLISASRQYCVKDVVESDNALGDMRLVTYVT